MNPSLIIKHLLSFVFVVILQITIFLHTSIFSVAYCYIYVAFVIFLPLSINRSWLMTIAFLTGVSIDMFYNTLGINAFACVTLAFFRNRIFYLFLGSSDFDENSPISLANLGIGIFIPYVTILLFIHHFLIFLLINWDNGKYFYVLYTSILSSLLTLFVIITGEYLFFREKR
jgi:hypothetical protein